MNDKIWWYLSRSSGIVAMALLVASVVWGVLLATRILRPIDRPAWLLDLHRWLGAMALVMTGLHLLGLVLDGYVSFGVADLLVPGAASYRPFAVAIGVLSMYLLVAVQVTSSFRHRLSPIVWRRVHRLSYGLVWGASLHASLAGSDTASPLYQALAIVLTIVATTATVIRIVNPGRARTAIAR